LGLLSFELDFENKVFYLLWENSDYVLIDRISRYLNQPPSDWHRSLAGKFCIRHVSDRTDLMSIGRELSIRVDDRDERILICVDSVNLAAETFVDIARARQVRTTASSYFDALADIARYARNCSELTHGHIAFILVSEENQRGEARGQKLEHSATQVLRLSRGDRIGEVNVNVSKAREGGDSDLGIYRRNPRTLQLEPPVTDREDPFGGPQASAF